MKVNSNIDNIKTWDTYRHKCVKCGRERYTEVPRLVRHHKGHDKFLGRFNSYIEKGYFKFRKCILLCDDCHAIIHAIYFEKVNLYGVNITEKKAMKLRDRYVKICNRWLAGVKSWDKFYTINHPTVKVFISKWRIS